jgi:hypothetical protein
MSFKQEFAKLLEKQKKMATGQRLEMLNRDLSGTEKLLEVVIWPILHSFEGIVLEYELVSLTGVKVYRRILRSFIRSPRKRRVCCACREGHTG